MRETTNLETSQRAASRRRDPALDLLRAVALLRVVVWHASAATWLTWFAAMPVLFFVAGTLLATSQEQRSHTAVLFRRCRRLLPALWVYGAVVAVAGLARAGGPGSFPFLSLESLRPALSWVVPLTDPASSDWHGGWLSTHLWYIRAYLWIVLLAPVLAYVARRGGWAILFFPAALASVTAAAWFRLPVLGAGTVHVVVGDLLVYGAFVALGMAYQSRRRDPDRRLLCIAALVAAGAAGGHAALFGLPPGGVNDSYPVIAFTGLAWLFAAGAAEGPIRRLAERPRVRRFTLAVNRRAVTIYLWHPAAIIAAYVAVETWAPPLPGAAETAAVLALAAPLMAVASFAVGWVEDLAAGRPCRLPLRLAPILSPTAAVMATVVPLAVLPIAPDAEGDGASRSSKRASLPPPSYRPALTDAAFATRAPAPRPDAVTLPGGPIPAGALQRALEQWMEGQEGFDSIAVGVAVAGQSWSGDAHRHGADPLTTARAQFPIASVTKTFTVALVLREVAAGRIDLDAPVPPLRGVGRPPAGVVITPRQLLKHTSGLVDYGGADGYDPEAPLSPAHAVRLSLATPLQSRPGEQTLYANTNYHYLGLLLEHVTGRSYRNLVASVAKPVRLDTTRVDASTRPGWVGFASGGVVSTVGDLARWGDALFTPGRVLPPWLVAELTTLDDHNSALGTFPLCPCSTDERGQKQATAVGQFSGHGGLWRFPDGLTLAVHMERPVEESDPRVLSLAEALRAALGRR